MFEDSFEEVAKIMKSEKFPYVKTKGVRFMQPSPLRKNLSMILEEPEVRSWVDIVKSNKVSE
jgi:hypothetical protein